MLVMKRSVVGKGHLYTGDGEGEEVDGEKKGSIIDPL